MREQEMRLRINRFLKARMSQTLMPAAMGLGLALAGCGEGKSLYMGPLPTDGPVRKDALVEAGPAPLYASPMDGPTPLGPDAFLTDTPIYSAPLPDARDALVDGSDASLPDARDAQASDAFAADATTIDAGTMDATPALDGGADLGAVVAKYIAPMPDAGPQDGTPVLRYMASFPDSGIDSA
jgi:hypothetical protein